MEPAGENQPVVYICATCGCETNPHMDGTIHCSTNPNHKVLYKKRASRPLVYKAI
ncbi:RNA polymerase II subunit Rpb12 [Giardia lamblia P15]|uniref:RNA polymerase II subunit Rpb12 n=1 Tax=Giardia intestinalis (strain P15) TaxID=658858 RepID=E1EYW8_GIAIA|nr:RNA polymerase II subunit Rpb12 [Giardia lamblia P15]